MKVKLTFRPPVVSFEPGLKDQQQLIKKMVGTYAKIDGMTKEKIREEMVKIIDVMSKIRIVREALISYLDKILEGIDEKHV